MDPSPMLPPLQSFPEWSAYCADPPTGLARLLQLAGARSTGVWEVTELLEDRFVQTSDWRFAQHLALWYSGRLSPSPAVDLVRAGYFAGRAVIESDGNPRARLALGHVHWERRIPLASLHEAQVARYSLGLQVCTSAADEQRRLRAIGDCARLAGLSYAYLRNMPMALDELALAESLGTLTFEAIVQVLLGARDDEYRATTWATERLLNVAGSLGGRVTARLQRALRCNVVALLAARSRALEVSAP